MDHQSRFKLAQLLIAKSITEALLIAGVSVGFYYLAFNPYFRGSLDTAEANNVAGWAVDEAHNNARVEVQLYIDGNFVADTLANKFRPDVHAAQRAQDDWHGFVFNTPRLATGEHEARVYAVHASGAGARLTLQLIGRPIRFHVESNPQ